MNHLIDFLSQLIRVIPQPFVYCSEPYYSVVRADGSYDCALRQSTNIANFPSDNSPLIAAAILVAAVIIAVAILRPPEKKRRRSR